jgi:hypothetical protein
MRSTRVLSAAASLLLVATLAQAQRGQGDRRGGQGQHAQASRQDAPRPGGDWRGGQSQARGADQGGGDRARADQARAQQDRANQARAEQDRANQARAEQARADQARAQEEQNRFRAAQQNAQWRDQQNRQAEQREQLERAQRAQQEAANAQRERAAQLNRVYDRDYRAGEYRYNIGGVYRLTNQYGADVLRQAVDQGYAEGYRAGSIDRDQGAPSDVQRALDFETDGFGYTGAYVPQSDYSFYFRQGFQRGYDDGYWSRSQYGTFTNGKAAILGAVALGILGLTLMH